MAELPKGVWLASGCFRPKGGVVTGRCFSRWGYRRIGLEILGLKMLFIEIHICLASLHLAWTTTYAWSRWFRLVISNFLLLPSVFAVFSRLDSFYTTSTQRILYVSRLFLVSLVPWIDKPWGNTLREKLHDPVRLRYINWGAKERQQAFLAPLPGNHRFKIQSYLHS